MFVCNRKTCFFTLAFSLAALVATPLFAKMVEVNAQANSSSGGSGKDTGINIFQGDILTVGVDPAEVWSAGSDQPCSRESNADGLTECYGPLVSANLTANFGSLVGRIGEGPYFLIGTGYREEMSVSGRLYLYYWDDYSADNSGSINAVITVAEAGLKPPSECTEKDEAGNYKMTSCSETCQMKFWRWSFWVTNYNVDASAGAGEHQGIGIFGYEYHFDSRFPPSSGIARTWEKEATSKGDFLKQISNPDHGGVQDSALCNSNHTIFRLIYNHGRTVANEAAYWDAFTVPPMTRLNTFTAGPLAHKQWSKAEDPDSERQAAASSCMRQIKDGFCDSVCGNCSYVIPLGLGTGDYDENNEIKYQRTQFTVEEEWAGIKSKTRYYQGRGPGGDPQWGFSSLGKPIQYPDPFTHCFSPTNSTVQQALTSRFTWGTLKQRVITGAYGHNSNSDAEAEMLHFESCAADPIAEVKRASSKSPNACEACGVPATKNGKPIQFPCIMNTNTAREKWARTDGLHNIDSEAEGLGTSPAEGQPPICLTNGEPVRGM